MNRRRFAVLAGVALVLAALAVYRNSLEAPFLFDDTPAIVGNRTIRRLWPPWEALSPPADGSGVAGRPIVNLSLAVNYAIGGLAVRGYHVMNLVLHIFAALTLWGVLRRTWSAAFRKGAGGVGDPALQRRGGNGDPAPQQGVPLTSRLPTVGPQVGSDPEVLAWCAALLWVVHPLLTESVTCVVQRTEVLGALFYLLTLYGFIRSTQGVRGGTGWQVLAVAFCLLGMASKEIEVTAPVLVLLYDRTFVAGTFRAAWERRKGFYGALAATWLLLAWLMVHEGWRAGTVGFGQGVSSWEYLLTQCRALTLYLKLSFWPHPLVVDYGTAVVDRLGDVWWQGLLVVGLLLATLLALWRRPVVGFLGACFFVILAPSSSFVPLVTQTIAEHRMYLPLAAVIVVAVAGVHALAGRATALVCLVLAAGLGVITSRRNEEYRNGMAIWAEAVATEPGNARAHSGLGTVYYNRGDFAAAQREFEESLRLEPRSAQVYYNLGLVMDKLGRIAAAVRQYAAAVRLAPTLGPAQAELGAALIKLGRTEEAIQHLRIALTYAPDLAAAQNSMGQALAGAGRKQEAIAAYGAALKLDPDSADVHFNLALALAAAGRPDDAFAHYADAVHLEPAHARARLNLGIMLAQRGRLTEALPQLREAARLRPGLPEVQLNLGLALALAGHAAEAIACYEEALRLRPDYAMAHYNLGNALAAQGRWSEAKRHFAEAARLAPDFAPAREKLKRLQDVTGGRPGPAQDN